MAGRILDRRAVLPALHVRRPDGGKLGLGAKWEWDFGDGQKSGKQSSEHVYLLPGEYTVTLTVQTQAKFTRTNRIVVSRPWDRIVRNELDRSRQHTDIVASYDFAALSPAASTEAVAMLHRGGRSDAAMRAGDALVGKNSGRRMNRSPTPCRFTASC